MADSAFHASAAEGFCSACLASVRRTFADHLPLYACVIIFGAAVFLIAALYRIEIPLSASLSFLEGVPLFVGFGVSVSAAVQLIRLLRMKEQRPLNAMARWLRDGFLSGERPGNIFHTLITLTPLMITFDALKEQIPQIHPFEWDETFTRWDRILGMGHLPWQILQPLVGHPPITAGLNFIYDLWFVLMFGCLFWQAFSAHASRLRMQFLVAFALAWFVGGDLLATVFSSAGPCFYGYLHPARDPYAPLMAYLRDTSLHWPIWSVKIQNLLWQSYTHGGGTVAGISAMPSMHVTIAVLLALLGVRTNRPLGIALTLFAAAVVVGSVALGWHYLVDGIGGVVLAILFWIAARIICRGQGQIPDVPIRYERAR
ncbi:MAG TPA: phosphatase PAP2 family protein [Rhizomicrobium sp.]|jgi:membrane-associated phospholipid phosphatase|nr:phosphatase PAP2 family protein [Rhizomicrobium sp.]